MRHTRRLAGRNLFCCCWLIFAFLNSASAQPAASQVTGAATLDATVQLSAGKIFYRDSGGAGLPVVFLHAGSGNSMLWERQIPVFTSAGYRFIAIDYRGLDNTAASTTSQRIVELLALLGVDRFHLIGTAAGGGAALQYALAHQEQLLSLTVANSIGNVQDAAYLDLGRRLRPPEFNQLPLELRELGPSYRAKDPEGVARWLELSGTEPVAVAAPVVTTGGTAQPSGTSVAADAVTWERLESLTIPVLLLTGAADLYTPPSVLRMFAAHIPQAVSHVVVESGHSAFWESAEEFNNVVLTFIQEQ